MSHGGGKRRAAISVAHRYRYNSAGNANDVVSCNPKPRRCALRRHFVIGGIFSFLPCDDAALPTLGHVTRVVKRRVIGPNPLPPHAAARVHQGFIHGFLGSAD